MCLLCVEWEKGNLTIEEAKRATAELMRGIDEYSEENLHYLDLYTKILDYEIKNENIPDGTGD